ncbi:hypothetical protein Goklo_007872 [Gossypium klotzschianum]|uniref:DUF4283 domain-containing protein n=1 Tax=Gossypium klotzschianum TaxID=34286 RepID=A0A7J8UY13_9ROSI|nr:hypothetical protein [Gossypium klotzschianum]
MADVEGNFADLSLEDKKEVVVRLASERLDLGASFENCFVGSFLTSSVINFQSMRAMLANMDTDRIKAGDHWNFNSHLLVMCRLRYGDDPKNVPLFNVDFWVLVQDLPHGFMSEILQEKQDFILGWDISLRALTRQAVAPKSVWLREEDMFGVANFGVSNFANKETNEGPLL